MEKESMAIATPSPANDAALNAQLDITRDASIANLRTQSEETRQQYTAEANKIADQKQRSAEVAQSNVNAALDNAAVRSEAEYNQAFKNLQTAQELAVRTSAANPRETRLPLELHRQVVESTQEFLSAQSDYVRTHPDKASDPAYNIKLAEDGNGGFQLVNGLDPGLAEQVTIASPDEARALPLDELRQLVQRKKNGIVQNADKPPVSLVDQPDGTFNVVLQSGETFKGFPQSLKGENREAIRRLAEGRVSTQQYYQSLLEQAVAQQQPANGQQTQPQAQPQAQPANNPTAENQSLTDWFLDETAKRFGYQNGNEMVADQNARYQREQRNNEVIERVNNQNTVAQFFSEHPDYPQTPQSDAALEQIINRNGWEWTPDTMAAAHALAVQNRVYQPLSQQEIAAANGYAPEAHRPVPPPMPRGGNPESGTPAQSEYEMPLDQLRKLALGAQRGGR
jgi:hypothetical protein